MSVLGRIKVAKALQMTCYGEEIIVKGESLSNHPIAKSIINKSNVNINTKKLPCIRIFRIQNSFISF